MAIRIIFVQDFFIRPISKLRGCKSNGIRKNKDLSPSVDTLQGSSNALQAMDFLGNLLITISLACSDSDSLRISNYTPAILFQGKNAAA
jgi:hypothetical protein